MLKLINRIFDPNQKEISRYQKVVEQINALEPEIRKLSDEDLRKKTEDFRKVAAPFYGAQKMAAQSAAATGGVSLDDLLPQAFAVAREAIRRVVGERAYDVQLMAALALHEGKIAEQKTGEGKTHAAAIAMYLNALTGRGVHSVTVNDYLARRDAGWYGKALAFLGLQVGCIIPSQSYLLDLEFVESGQSDPRLRHLKPVSRQQAYQADITYGTNNEFGFDYLRDNMVADLSAMVQTNPVGEWGAHNFAIVDEIDFALIDEARTPLIISAPAEESNELYLKFAQIVPKLKSEDYDLDEKARTVILTDLGVKKIERALGVKNLYAEHQLAHHLDQALKAEFVYQRDKDYIVKDNEVIIVDEFTGRLMEGRRYSEGLHQAIEAKENVPIQKESKTLATITFQNYFRMYDKLAGMTGTAATEAEEFHKIYGLDVVVIPTNEPMIRKDHADRIYKHQRAKWKAVVDEIEERCKKGQPVLVGTTSVEKNELVSQLLKRRGIKHEVLNAKNHEREAQVVAGAGEKEAVTVATNMAGRGTDITLGPGVKELGGLFVLGTERHEARRIDNQLRGRAGRQGDPGESRFYVGLDDDLMRIFGGDAVANLMTRFNLPEDVPIESGMVSKAIQNAQVKVESHNFDIRKHLVEYDDVINKQREIVYARRRRLLEADLNPTGLNRLNPSGFGESRRVDQGEFNLRSWVIERIQRHHEQPEAALKKFEEREKKLGKELMHRVIRWVSLTITDQLWMDHIDALDELRGGIGLRGYGQRDPLVEFKNEAFGMFERLIKAMDWEIAHRVLQVEVTAPKPEAVVDLQKLQQQHREVGQFAMAGAGGEKSRAFNKSSKLGFGESPAAGTNKARPVVKSQQEKVGRNDPCPCGSGLKYKKCGLINAPEHRR